MSKRNSEVDDVEAISLRQRSSVSPGPSGTEPFETDYGSISEYDEKHKKRKRIWTGLWLNTSGEHEDGAHKVSPTFAILTTLLLMSVGLLTVKYLDGHLPEALLIRDIPENPTSFIEERARNDLERLISVGVRVQGSPETDTTTVNTIMEMLKDIKDNVLTYEHTLEYEVQRPSGAFFMGKDDNLFSSSTSSYSKIANVVAKLEPVNTARATNDSILVNCHFDTKPGSPGATDNMISCATMLEVLRVLAGEIPTSLKNPIVFLFNGAEELGLQGAHGFVKGYEGSLGYPENGVLGHRWSKNLRTFINLEGAGGGGREILFQTGPGNGWTLEAYAKSAPYPYGVVIAEEGFQRGLIPSDTDFRIFRDYGKLSGLDMAFIKNGWVYHTKWDKLSEIPPGSLQHMGANALAILKHLSSKIDFSEVDTDSSGKMVYFDVFGLFMIFYPRWAGMVIDCVIAIATIAAILMNVISNAKNKRRVVIALIWLPLSAILSWIVGIGVAAIVALFLNACGYYKPFYTYPFLATVIFGVPAAIAQTLVHAHAQNRSSMQTWLAQKLALAIVLFVMTFITRAVYIISINLLFSVISWHLVKYLFKGWPRAITIAHLIIGELIPFMFSAYVLVTLSDTFVPITGRSGSEMNGNLFFGVITAAVVIVLIWSGFCFIFAQFRRRVLWTCLLSMFFVFNSLLVFGYVGKVPYEEKTPMRINIVDVDRTWYAANGVNETKGEAGYWIWPYDSNTKDFLPIFETYAPELAGVESMKLNYNECDNLFCAQPFLWTMGSVKTTHWLPHNARLPSSVRSEVDMTFNATDSTSFKRRVEFSFKGPSQKAIVLSTGPNYKLTSWTIADEVPSSGGKWKDRDTYFIFNGRGVGEQDIKVNCEFQQVGSNALNFSLIANIQYSAFYLYGEHLMTPEFAKLVDKLPGWSYTMPWTAVMKMYEIHKAS